MKKCSTSIILTAAMLILFAGNVMGAPENQDVPSSVLTTTTIKVDGEAIEVPVMKNDLTARVLGGITQDSETIFIPDFSQITRAENAENVARIHSRSVDTDSFTDNGQYILFDSTLSYNNIKYQAPNGWYYDLVDLISFKISREIYTSAPFTGFRNPEATAMQIGPIDGPGAPILDQIYSQKKSYGTINFDSTYSVPTSWRAVIPNAVDYYVGVRYQIQILPTNGRNYTVDHWHLAR